MLVVQVEQEMHAYRQVEEKDVGGIEQEMHAYRQVEEKNVGGKG